MQPIGIIIRSKFGKRKRKQHITTLEHDLGIAEPETTNDKIKIGSFVKATWWGNETDLGTVIDIEEHDHCIGLQNVYIIETTRGKIIKRGKSCVKTIKVK